MSCSAGGSKLAGGVGSRSRAGGEIRKRQGAGTRGWEQLEEREQELGEVGARWNWTGRRARRARLEETSRERGKERRSGASRTEETRERWRAGPTGAKSELG